MQQDSGLFKSGADTGVVNDIGFTAGSSVKNFVCILPWPEFHCPCRERQVDFSKILLALTSQIVLNCHFAPTWKTFAEVFLQRQMSSYSSIVRKTSTVETILIPIFRSLFDLFHGHGQ